MQNAPVAALEELHEEAVAKHDELSEVASSAGMLETHTALEATHAALVEMTQMHDEKHQALLEVRGQHEVLSGEHTKLNTKFEQTVQAHHHEVQSLKGQLVVATAKPRQPDAAHVAAGQHPAEHTDAYHAQHASLPPLDAHVQVACRVRHSTANNGQTAIEDIDEHSIKVANHMFNFDHVLDPDATQQDVFTHT